MPINKYFKGHGSEVMQSMRNAHPGASDEKIQSEFYATANKTKMKPDKNKTMKPGQGTTRGKVARLKRIKAVKKFKGRPIKFRDDDNNQSTA